MLEKAEVTTVMGQFSWSRFLCRSSLFKWFRNMALIGIAIIVAVWLWQYVYTLFEMNYLPTLGCTKNSVKCPQPADIHGSMVVYLLLIVCTQTKFARTVH